MTMQKNAEMVKNGHPDLEAFDGLYFSVADDCDLWNDVGRHVRFTEAAAGRGGGTVYHHLCVIIGVQRIYDGSLAYRVKSTEFDDVFGMPARPRDIVFVD